MRQTVTTILKLKSTKFIQLVAMFLISLSLFSISALADTTTVETITITDNIFPDETAEFILNITNNANSSQDYTIYSLTSGQGWSIDPTSLSDKVVEDVAPGESYEVPMTVVPITENDPGIHLLSVQIKGELEEESIDTQLKVYLGNLENSKYLPSFSVEIDMDETINPKDAVSVVIHLENGNSLDIEDLTLNIDSDIPEFNKEFPIGLLGLEEKTSEFTFELNPYTQSKEYYLFFTFKSGDETIKVVNQKIEIEALVSDFEYTLTEEKQFLKQNLNFIIKNEGNVENSQFFNYPISRAASLFISFPNQDLAPGTVYTDGDQTYISWELQLDPSEEFAITATYNYRPMLYAIIFFLAIIIFYLLVRSPVSISKKATVVVGNKEEISEIKVLLEIKNKRKEPLSKIEIIDYVPGIVNVERTVGLGTIKPSKVTHSKKGSKITWNMEELDHLEQRIISYKVKAKLNIVGVLKLPRAKVIYTNPKGKEMKSFSNLFRLSAQSLAIEKTNKK